MTTDREEIERLHERDMRASKAQDYATLRTLMSEDAVVLPPGGRAIRGKATIDAGFDKMQSVEPVNDVLEYRFAWEEVRILGDYAFEWGTIHGRERDRRTGAETTSAYHVMRILQRQADGSWKVHRTIWNERAT